MNGVTVVIRCKDDERVFDCIDSIDEPAEVIVSTSPDGSFQKILEDAGVRYCLSAAGNLSVTSNAGIENASNDKVIITDSDTLFDPGAVCIMSQSLDSHDVCRARLLFDTEGGSFVSGLVSNARQFVNDKSLAFTPGLGIRKSSLDRFGGMYFDETTPFAVDANLNHRIGVHGADVDYTRDAVVRHVAESVKHDLKAARRIGAGVQVSARSLFEHYGGKISEKEIRRDLKAVHHTDYGSILHAYGIPTTMYQALWDISFYAGRTSAGWRARK